MPPFTFLILSPTDKEPIKTNCNRNEIYFNATRCHTVAFGLQTGKRPD